MAGQICGCVCVSLSVSLKIRTHPCLVVRCSTVFSYTIMLFLPQALLPLSFPHTFLLPSSSHLTPLAMIQLGNISICPHLATYLIYSTPSEPCIDQGLLFSERDFLWCLPQQYLLYLQAEKGMGWAFTAQRGTGNRSMSKYTGKKSHI